MSNSIQPSSEPSPELIPVTAPKHGVPEVLRLPKQLTAAIAKLKAGHGPIAIDTERASGFRYGQSAYLVQLFRRGAGTFLIDPRALPDLTSLQQAFTQEQWVFHAASQDLPCLHPLGITPANIFDTELAGRLLNLPRVGLGSMVATYLGLSLAKEHSAADWSVRPLPKSWLLYACLDVELLIDLRDKVADALVAANKVEIAQQEFDYLGVPKIDPPVIDPWRKLSGTNKVAGPRGLAVLRELWETRDRIARDLNEAPRRVLDDASMVFAARNTPRSVRELQANRGFLAPAAQPYLQTFFNAIQRGMTMPTAQLPPRVAPTNPAIPPRKAWQFRRPEAFLRLQSCRVALDEIAADLDLPHDNVLTPEHLRRLVWNHEPPITSGEVAALLTEFGARPWQIELTATVLAENINEPKELPAPHAVTAPASATESRAARTRR